MKLGQFKKKILKEFAKSPAKTIILIALCPVALYFVVPLFWNSKPRVNKAQAVKVIAPNLNPSTTPLANPVPVAEADAGPSWSELIGWIEADARRKPGQIAVDQRNPFQPPVIAVEPAVAVPEAPPQDPAEAVAFTEETFAALGFKLTGTLVGAHSRSATINGERYLEGKPVPLPGSNPRAGADEHAFVLAHVGVRHVILELDGMRFRLALDAFSGPGSGITVVRGTPQAFP